MRTKLIFLLLLIICFACGTNNKPVSDAQKEKITGEIKELQYTTIKALEEVNWDVATEPILDSPDFVYTYNGKTSNYEEFKAYKPAFETRLNQKCTIVNEKFAVLDNSIVLYTMNCTWLSNYKDGHSILSDPSVTQVLYKKIDNRWRAININESGVEQSVKNTEAANQLNQVELMKQFIGSWKFDVAKDTIGFVDMKSYGTGLEGSYKIVTTGKITFEGKLLWGYDKNIDKFLQTDMSKENDIHIYNYRFITNKKYEILPYDFSNPKEVSWKCEGEFTSPDIFVETTTKKDKPPTTVTFTRVK